MDKRSCFRLTTAILAPLTLQACASGSYVPPIDRGYGDSSIMRLDSQISQLTAETRLALALAKQIEDECLSSAHPNQCLGMVEEGVNLAADGTTKYIESCTAIVDPKLGNDPGIEALRTKCMDNELRFEATSGGLTDKFVDAEMHAIGSSANGRASRKNEEAKNVWTKTNLYMMSWRPQFVAISKALPL